ncbi:MAG: hypothetical protein HOP28_13165 [Gemmatimonadales bacterium]|nr:hypothetical protein [Gemmatimonadales bacterium]
MSGVGPAARLGAPAADAHAKLRQAAHQLEAVFLTQLMQVMRETVPEGGFMPRSDAEKMFTAMLDERLAGSAAARNERGIGETLYRQLSRLLPPEEGAPR